MAWKMVDWWHYFCCIRVLYVFFAVCILLFMSSTGILDKNIKNTHMHKKCFADEWILINGESDLGYCPWVHAPRSSSNFFGRQSDEKNLSIWSLFRHWSFEFWDKPIEMGLLLLLLLLLLLNPMGRTECLVVYFYPIQWFSFIRSKK